MPDGAESKAAKPATEGASTAGAFSRLSELAWRALPAIGSAIGFVGFVAIVGGAIEWIRFDAASLPATQAVLAVPRQELVVVGALALAVFVLAAVAAVLVVYLIDSDGNATPRTARGLIAVGVAEMIVTLFFIGSHSVLKYIWLGAWLILIVLLALGAVSYVMRDFRRRTKVKHARARVLQAHAALRLAEHAQTAAEQTDTEHSGEKSKEASAQALGAAKKARDEFAQAIDEWMFATNRVLALQVLAMRKRTLARIQYWRKEVEGFKLDTPGVVEVEAVLDEVERRLGHAFSAAVAQAVGHITKDPQDDQAVAQSDAVAKTDKAVDENPPVITDRVKRVRALVVAAAAGSAVLICVGLGFLLGEVPWGAVLFVVVALLTAMNVFVARATDKFALYGIAVFFSVLMFGAALTIARTLHNPKVQPVALVRKDNEVGICGVFIAQTSERVYVGRLPFAGYRPGEIFWVPTSDVDLISVGQPESIGEDANKKTFSFYAESVLDRLYKDRAEEAAPTLKNTTTTTVSGSPPPGTQTTTGIETPPTKERSKRHPNVKIYGKSCTATQHVDP